MAPRKKPEQTGDDKSPQLAAAAVDQSAELVQTQAKPLQSVALEQAADAQGVDLVAANPGDEQPLEEEVGISDAALVMAVDDGQPDWLLGQFDVTAKSPAGFWRCGIHFLHSSATRVFVVKSTDHVPHDHDCEIPCCYLTQEEAKRVYGEPWLKVLIDSEVIKD